MRRLLIVPLMLVAGLACERQPEAPTTPSPTTTTIPAPTARALMQPVGVASFPNCTPFSTCTFSATLVNNGAGCAYRIEGTVRLFDKDGLQLGGPYHFSLPPTQVVQAGERVAYFANFVPFAQALVMYSYLTDPLWIDTACR